MSETNKDFLLSVVVPVYKEEHNITPFLERIEKSLEQLGCRYEILFCLDPSPDNTWQVIKDHISRNSRIRLIQFSRRFGQPAATMAGILNCDGDICVPIDVDLQDPPELIIHMVEKWQAGFDVVYAQRSSREGETLIKSVVSVIGYKVINALGEVSIPVNTGDFRLIDRRVIEEMRKLNEHNGFLRGAVAYVGFKQTAVRYERDARYSGKGNYNRFLGSLRIGLNGLFCFSSKPLQIMSAFGVVMAFVGFLFAIWYFVQKAFLNYDLTPGLSTTVMLVTFFSGVQLLCIGILGEYIGRIYDEVKHRPLYIVDKTENVSKEKPFFTPGFPLEKP